MDKSAQVSVDFIRAILPVVRKRFFSSDARLHTQQLEEVLWTATYEDIDFLRTLALLSATRLQMEAPEDVTVLRCIRVVLEHHYLNQLTYSEVVSESRKRLARLDQQRRAEKKKRGWAEMVNNKDDQSFGEWMGSQEEKERKKLQKKVFTHETDRQRLLALNQMKWEDARSTFLHSAGSPDEEPR